MVLSACLLHAMMFLVAHFTVVADSPGESVLFEPLHISPLVAYTPAQYPWPPRRCYGETALPIGNSSVKLPQEPYEQSVNPFLPTGCITYCDRYREVFERRLGPNVNVAPATKAIIVKVVWQYSYSPDFFWFVRSLIHETPGYHVYMLLHTSTARHPQKVHVPAEFADIAIVVDELDLQRMFPRHFVDGWYHGDYAAFYFWQLIGRKRKYEFLWSLEGDVRYVGKSWGAFLDSSWKYAVEQQHPLDTLPDYVTYYPSCRPKATWGWVNSTFDWGVSLLDKRYAHIMVSGMSPRILNSAIHLTSQNVSAYAELFLPTVAVLYNFKTAWVKHSLYGTQELGLAGPRVCDLEATTQCSFSFLAGGSYTWHRHGYAANAYSIWLNSSQCHGYALLHKVMDHTIRSSLPKPFPGSKNSGLAEVKE